MQSDRATNNNGGRTMEVKAAAPRCQLLLIVLMAVMLLPGMEGSPLLIQRTVTRTFVLQETIGKGFNRRRKIVQPLYLQQEMKERTERKLVQNQSGHDGNLSGTDAPYDKEMWFPIFSIPYVN
ncbi:hypothetical protein STEG23_003991, partial [Scotinomys teguina]